MIHLSKISNIHYFFLNLYKLSLNNLSKDKATNTNIQTPYPSNSESIIFQSARLLVRVCLTHLYTTI